MPELLPSHRLHDVCFASTGNASSAVLTQETGRVLRVIAEYGPASTLSTVSFESHAAENTPARVLGYPSFTIAVRLCRPPLIPSYTKNRGYGDADPVAFLGCSRSSRDLRVSPNVLATPKQMSSFRPFFLGITIGRFSPGLVMM